MIEREVDELMDGEREAENEVLDELLMDFEDVLVEEWEGVSVRVEEGEIDAADVSEMEGVREKEEEIDLEREREGVGDSLWDLEEEGERVLDPDLLEDAEEEKEGEKEREVETVREGEREEAGEEEAELEKEIEGEEEGVTEVEGDTEGNVLLDLLEE